MSSHAQPTPLAAPTAPSLAPPSGDAENGDTDEIPAAAAPAAVRRTFAFPEAIRRFLASTRFAVIATVNADGSPHQAVVWYRLDDDTITINSAEGRRWPSNLRRDPRISFFVEDGYQWISVRGSVEVIEDRAVALADIASMAYRYQDDRAEAEKQIDVYRTQARVSFRIRPTSVSASLDEEEE